MNKLENRIRDILSKEINIPTSYENAIKLAFTNKQKNIKLFKIYKMISLSCMCVIILVGFVYAEDIKNIIVNFYNNSKGVDIAIEHDYIMNSQAEYIESNNTSIAIKNILMDDFNLSMTLSLKLDSKVDVTEIKSVRLTDMIITDEENRIIYCDNEEIFNEYCTTHNLNYKFGEFNENYINNGLNFYIKQKLKENNAIELIYNLFSSKYPKSKKIFVGLKQINMSKQEVYDNEELVVTGDWNIELDIPEKFYNRDSVIYTVKNCNDESINVTDASVYDTGMKFEFSTSVNPVYNENDSEEIISKKKEELHKWHMNLVSSLSNIVSEEYIENNNGDKFYPSESNSEQAGTDYGVDGQIKHWQTFNLTKYDMTDNMRIHFMLNTKENSRDVVIELERKK